MRLTTNHLMILLAVSRGTYDNELKLGNNGGLVSTLINLDLVTGLVTGPLQITARGQAHVSWVLDNFNATVIEEEGQLKARVPMDELVNLVVNLCDADGSMFTGLFEPGPVMHNTKHEFPRHAANCATWNEQLGTFMLEDSKFHMVAAGSVTPEGRLVKLTAPPRSVHQHMSTAREQAEKLASRHRDVKFFVLSAQAVYCHPKDQVEQVPVQRMEERRVEGQLGRKTL